MGGSPAALIPGHRESYLVRISEAVHRVMGFDPPIGNAGSNNSSAALREGISSISTGAGPCDGAHSLAENCEIEPLYKGFCCWRQRWRGLSNPAQLSTRPTLPAQV